MGFYSIPSKEVLEAVKGKKRLGEKVKISKKVQLNDKVYREVLFFKTVLFKGKKQDTGIVYIDENNGIIEDDYICKKLAKDFHYYITFFDESTGTSLARALQSDGNIKNDKKDHTDAMIACDILAEDGVKQAELVKTICEKVIILREKTNALLKEILDENAIYSRKKEYISEEFIEQVGVKYKEVMSFNFEKVLLISKGINIYETVQDALYKKKKKINVRVTQKSVVNSMSKLDFLIGYYKKILRTYESVLSLNMKQYMNQLEKFDKAKIDARRDLIRK